MATLISTFVWLWTTLIVTCHAQYGYYNQQYPPGFGPIQPNPHINIRPDVLRDLDGRNWFDPLQPDPNRPKPAFNQRMYEHSDQRCRDLVTRENYDEYVQVSLRFGKVIGRIAYLCDHPEVKYHERPVIGDHLNRLSYDSMTNRYAGSIPRIRGNVSVFLGVPYARPPTRDSGLRFKPPQPPLQHGTIDASKFKPACPQPRKYTGESKMVPEMDEDCLYLNIYSPFVRSTVRVPYAVMLYLHGGDFQHGTGNTFPGYQLAASQEVVVVTINYRLGIFGFLATGDKFAPGNYGLMDVQQALLWLKENIINFNGDPDRITLFGPGSGGAIAGFMAVSPISRRLVRRVIAQAGSMAADWALQTDFLQIQNSSRAAAKQFGCPEHSSEQLVRCFTAKSYAIALEEAKPEVGWLPFTPVLDRHTRRPEDQVLPDRPEILLAEASSALFGSGDNHVLAPAFSGIDDRMQSANDFFDSYLTGVARDDGMAKLLSDPVLASRQFHVDRDVFKVKVKEYLNIYNETLNEKAMLDAIEFMYSPWSDRTNLTLWRQGLIDMYSDSWYLAGVDKIMKLLIANNVRTYMYVLNYTLEGLNLPFWYGVPHDTEYLLASGAPFMDYRFYPSELKLNEARWTEADRNMSSFFMQSWANFAKKGNPTPVSILNQFLWRTSSVKMEYLSVNSTNHTNVMLREYRQKESQFWNEYVHTLRGLRPYLWPLEFEPLHEEVRVYRAFTWIALILVVIFFFMTVLCSCLYCRAKSDRIGDAAIDFVDLVATGTQYTTPSSKANSELSLNRHNLNGSFSGAKFDSLFNSGTIGGQGGTMSSTNSRYLNQNKQNLLTKSGGRYSRVASYATDRNYR